MPAMGDVSAEPSMEDILASIKRIIADEDAAPRARGDEEDAASPGSGDTSTEAAEQGCSAHDSDATPGQVATAAAPVETILSSETAQATRAALDALSRLAVKPDGPSDNTLESLVREMLRPMLREWMDAKLPGIVEMMVTREIARITGDRG